jgi:hypothetical protein
MLKSLKSWLTLSATIKPFVSRSGTGAKTFGVSANVSCYAEGKVQVVTNAEGKEVVSNMQLYVDGDTVVAERDNIIFNSKESEVQAIGYFYRNGVVDIKVVYL